MCSNIYIQQRTSQCLNGAGVHFHMPFNGNFFFCFAGHVTFGGGGSPTISDLTQHFCFAVVSQNSDQSGTVLQLMT